MFNAKKTFSPKAMFTAGKRLFDKASNAVLWVGADYGIHSGDMLMMTSEGSHWVSTAIGTPISDTMTICNTSSGGLKSLSMDDITAQVLRDVSNRLGISKDYMRQQEEYVTASEIRRRQEQSMKRYDRDLDNWRGRNAFYDREKIKTEVFRQPGGVELWRRTCMVTGETRDELKQQPRGYY